MQKTGTTQTPQIIPYKGTQPSSAIIDTDEVPSLTATVNPSNATNKTLTWESDDSSVATISSNGVVTAKAPGTVTMTVRTFNGKTDSITLTVRQPYTLIFDPNGGTCEIDRFTAYSNYPIYKNDWTYGYLPILEKWNSIGYWYKFKGWYTL